MRSFGAQTLTTPVEQWEARKAAVSAALEQWQVFPVTLFLEVLNRDEVQGGGVDAVAEACWRRAIVEHMPEVRAGDFRVNLGARHAQCHVFVCFDACGLERTGEARPTGAGVILVFRAEEWLAAHAVHVQPCLMVVPKCISKWRLGPFALGHVVLQGIEALFDRGWRWLLKFARRQG